MATQAWTIPPGLPPALGCTHSSGDRQLVLSIVEFELHNRVEFKSSYHINERTTLTGVIVVVDIVTGLNGPTGLAVEREEPIPTMSQWGLLSMALSLTIVGTFLFRRNLGSLMAKSL